LQADIAIEQAIPEIIKKRITCFCCMLFIEEIFRVNKWVKRGAG
jgi:hypothetical protein